MQIGQKLDYWKNRLLDLGKRNRLINCALPKEGARVSRTALIIYEPATDNLWNALTDSEKPLEFPVPAHTFDDDGDKKKTSGAEAFPNGIRTDQTPVETCKTLRTLMKKSREFIEEKGLNALYLAFGFLHWKEQGVGGQEMRSPLLLVPVVLSQENLNAPIILARSDDEITANNALEQKLINDFRITLPAFDEAKGLGEYLSTVRSVCSSLKWSVEADAAQLSMFSFLKMNMYRDLESNAEKIAAHPIVRALNGEAFDSGVDCSDMGSFNHDALEPREVFSVVDADSSQQDAIVLAKRGASFVLQGPPGTGKSQTITNVLAELVADGKKVLFVAEKMAALEVVHKRLKQAGLGPFCLTLHSHNAKRREVLDQLDISLKLSTQKAQVQQEAFNKLYQLKEARSALNEYSSELHTVIEPLGKTIYQVNGFVSGYSGYKDMDYIQTDAKIFTQDLLAKCETALEELSRLGYQLDNPWNGCVLTTAAHEFRQEFSVDSEKLFQLIDKGTALYNNLSALTEAKAIPFSRLSIKDAEVFLSAAQNPATAFEWLELNLSEYLDTANELISKSEYVRQHFANSNSSIAELETEIEQATGVLLNGFHNKIFSVDLKEMLERYQNAYGSVFRVFKRGYYQDSQTLRSLSKTGAKMSYTEALSILVKASGLAERKSLHEKRKEIEKLETLFRGQRKALNRESGADIAQVRAELESALKIQDYYKKYGMGAAFAQKICSKDRAALTALTDCVLALRQWEATIQPSANKFYSLFDEARRRELEALPFPALKQAVKDCGIASLEHLLDYRNAEQSLTKLGLDSYLAKAKELAIPARELAPVFKKCFYRSWLDAVTPQYKAVSAFRRERQDGYIAQFKGLDKLHMEISKAALIAKLIARLPNFDSFSGSGGEIALLRREMAKQRKLMPTRKLIAALPNLLPVIKPCMMMSPLSASTYLGSGGYEFDTVIFDEASQVRTEDALCSIFRAKQAIIVGDSRQLPPTDFFATAISDTNEYEEDEEGEVNDTGAYESLLDEATVLPSQTLKWHYRSKHEHLIAFSNAKIYQGNLITFPSAVEKLGDMGVEHVYVQDGIYERGGKNGNRKEAERVAQLVFEHFSAYPKRSLGIIAFGEVQQTAIEDALLRKRRDNPQFESFFRAGDEEALFIKNLETVQGDERDTIIFSIGYAPDAAGKFTMNFGPLSRTGGERRLNVAVTRARYNLKLVSSILPTDIDTNRTSGQGPKLLRLYIDFAINGAQAILGERTANGGWFDSPFEESVYSFLTANEYSVATQVGCSGYRIDMAVRHPLKNGSFAIGIECDGAAYHSARTARERDRLRQSVLEGMGWKMYRVWSTDWIKDVRAEGERLLNAVRASVDNNAAATAPSAPQPADFLEVSEKSAAEVVSKKKGDVRSHYAGRKVNEVPFFDYEQTMMRVLESNFGLDKAALFKETAQHGYEWQRQGDAIKKKFEDVYQSLLQRGKIAEDGEGKIKGR